MEAVSDIMTVAVDLDVKHQFKLTYFDIYKKDWNRVEHEKFYNL